MDDENFIQNCLALIDGNAKDTFQSESFRNLDASSLKRILSRDTLYTPEVDVWKAVCAWSEAECKRQGKIVSCEEMFIWSYLSMQNEVFSPSV